MPGTLCRHCPAVAVDSRRYAQSASSLMCPIYKDKRTLLPPQFRIGSEDSELTRSEDARELLRLKY